MAEIEVDQGQKTIAEDLYPARFRSKDIKAVPAKPGEDSSADLTANQVAIVTGNNAYERTQRLHEALHILHSKEIPASDAVGQAIEDMRLHTHYARTTGQVRREEVAAALHDMRAAAQESRKSIGSIKDIGGSGYGNGRHDMALVGVVRAAAILARGGWRLPGSRTQLGKAVVNLTDRPKDLLKAIDAAVEYVKLSNYKQAKEVLQEYFVTAECNGGDGDEYAEDMNSKGRSKDFPGIYQPPKEPSEDDGGIEFKDLDMPMYNRMWFNKRKKNYARELRQLERAGKIPAMRHHQLTLTKFRELLREGPKEKSCMAGMRIRAKRLALAFSPTPPRLFLRKITQKKVKGGTVLIDSSGSMHLSNTALKTISDMIPAGTVAYYSGLCDSNPVGGGDLVIYAMKGKQYTGTDLPHRHNGNMIDLQALEWLMQQESPRIMVTDRGFTGPCQDIAKQMLRDAEVAKRVSVVGNAAALRAELKKHGVEISDAIMQEAE